MTGTEPSRSASLGWIATFIVVALYGGLAVSVDVPAASGGIFSDEATYYLMGHSLAADGDLEYRREDLERVWREFPSGPAGVFLKRGTDVTGIGVTAVPPFVTFPGPADPDPERLYYGKSFIYPLVAAPFVRVLGTNGFLFLNALLLGLAFLLAYTFVNARSEPIVSLLLASAFVFATVVPVYAVWIAPELFNFTLGMLAFFLWLYKYVVDSDRRPPRWVHRPVTDYLSAGLMGVLTFSKVTNALLLAPLVAWLAWKGQWRRALGVTVAWLVVTVLLFGANVAVSGEWNFQGGTRVTCYDTFPFQQEGRGLEVCGERGRDAALGDVIFDREVFWTNLRANLGYFVVGRNSGLLAYFFPVMFAALALILARGRRAPWQWFVFAAIAAQALLFIVSLPYTYFGSGGSIGNRYFMGVYGLGIFLLPPLRSRALVAVPWLVGGVFMAGLVLNPFATSIRPGEHSRHGLFRLLPVELTNLNDLPLNTERDLRVIWYGEDPELGDPGFQIFRLDDNSHLREIDPSFWVRGESTAQMLVRTDRPMRRLQLRLAAGAAATEVTTRLGDRSVRTALSAYGSAVVVFDLPPGFPYKHNRPIESPGPSYVWELVISSNEGFTPVLVDPESVDTRYLGVRVRPVIVE